MADVFNMDNKNIQSKQPTVYPWTSIKQSEMLKTFLPIESADMHYWLAWRGDVSEEKKNTPKPGIPCKDIRKYLWCPCWSLIALLNLFDWPKLSTSSLGDGTIGVMISTYPNGYRHDSGWFDNPIDACYEMICKLHKQKLL